MENHGINLAAGDGFLQYSDGVSEATYEALDEFGIERLRTVAAEHRARPAGEIVGGVVRAVGRFVGDCPRSDDITILALKRAEAAESGCAGPGGARKEYDKANR